MAANQASTPKISRSATGPKKAKLLSQAVPASFGKGGQGLMAWPYVIAV